MPLDYEDPDEIVLGKDLKEGECVRSRSWSDEKDGNDMGIIISTTFHDTKRGRRLKKFYGDEPAYSMYDINCPCDSSLYSRLDPEAEFKVIRSRKDILYTYKTIDYQLLKRSSSLMKESIELEKVQDQAVERMNDRCDKIKKELEKDYTCKHAHANINKIYCDTENINSCPDGYEKVYTEETCPELKEKKDV
ncbi:MAG: hypothetical protein DRI84_05395 [Bacteroidetes bacterium]|nr:MAG: hypothetical protein DRI84_05395 [Bacteroidota bacterium]